MCFRQLDIFRLVFFLGGGDTYTNVYVALKSLPSKIIFDYNVTDTFCIYCRTRVYLTI